MWLGADFVRGTCAKGGEGWDEGWRHCKCWSRAAIDLPRVMVVLKALERRQVNRSIGFEAMGCVTVLCDITRDGAKDLISGRQESARGIDSDMRLHHLDV